MPAPTRRRRHRSWSISTWPRPRFWPTSSRPCRTSHQPARGTVLGQGLFRPSQLGDRLYKLNVDQTTGAASLSYAIDLRRDTLRVIAAPGQDPNATVEFNLVRGVSESVVERSVLQAITPTTNGQPGQVYSTATVFDVAQAQGVPLIVITQDTLGLLDGLAIDANAKAEITTEVTQGNMVIVPAQNVPVNGTRRRRGTRSTRQRGRRSA